MLGDLVRATGVASATAGTFDAQHALHPLRPIVIRTVEVRFDMLEIVEIDGATGAS
jgi:hypothetical protein